VIGVIVSGLITLARCLVIIMGGGEGKNGSSVAVSVTMVTTVLIVSLTRIPVSYLQSSHY